MADLNPIQAMMNGMSAQWQKDRAGSQMTLGSLIYELEKMRPTDLIEGFGSPHSYRGYYSDLAFERADAPILVSDALTICRKCMGEVFEGYKGGEFQMGRKTPIWFASYGSCGTRIMSLSEKGQFETKDEESAF